MLNLLKLADQLIHHEGMECFPYVDTVGKTTIGVGRNLTDRGLSQDECRYLLANDIEISISELKRNFDWFTKLDDTRQAARAQTLARMLQLGDNHANSNNDRSF